MSLPTAKPPAASQPSIRSFFQSKQPKYAPPPSQAPAPTTTTPPPPPPAPRENAESKTTTTNVTNGTNGTTASQQQHQQQPQEAGSDSSFPQPSIDAPLPPMPTNLPREASIQPVTADNISALRRINALLLPVSFSEPFYQRALDPSASGRFSRVITWAHEGEAAKVVGGVVCRVEASGVGHKDPQNLYIQSLCLLSPYRGLGLINAALDHVVTTAVVDANLDVRAVTAHVWTQNEEGLHWYEARGFKRQEPAIDGYYLKLRPSSAYIVRRDVSATVRSSLPSASPPIADQAKKVPSSITAAVVNLPPRSSPSPPSSTPPPPAMKNGGPPPPKAPGQSYQTKGPGMEWNDLPEDMAPTQLAALRKTGSEPASSNASSRSSSTARKKRDRSYPAAAFGS